MDVLFRHASQPSRVGKADRLVNGHSIALIQALEPDMIIVVAYGKILPLWLLQFPRYGCINVHGSILPKYRGAAPVHWAIANGEKTTGVCTMLLDEGLDTGPVFLCEETNIGPDETAPQLYDRLGELGASVLIETVNGVVNGTLKPKPQDDSRATFDRGSGACRRSMCLRRSRCRSSTSRRRSTNR